jgi:hypothetical protein
MEDFATRMLAMHLYQVLRKGFGQDSDESLHSSPSDKAKPKRQFWPQEHLLSAAVVIRSIQSKPEFGIYKVLDLSRKPYPSTSGSPNLINWCAGGDAGLG